MPAEVLTAAGVSELAFGKDYVIPSPWTPACCRGLPVPWRWRRLPQGGPHRTARQITCWVESRQARKNRRAPVRAPFRMAGAGSFTWSWGNLTAGALAWAALWCFFTTWSGWRGERRPWSGVAAMVKPEVRAKTAARVRGSACSYSSSSFGLMTWSVSP